MIKSTKSIVANYFNKDYVSMCPTHNQQLFSVNADHNNIGYHFKRVILSILPGVEIFDQILNLFNINLNTIFWKIIII